MTRKYVYHEVLTFVPNENPVEAERPKCDICQEPPFQDADFSENGVNFCARHYAAYRNLKVR
jgi:formylmethanofuran dehydrogenase subunit E